MNRCGPCGAIDICPHIPVKSSGTKTPTHVTRDMQTAHRLICAEKWIAMHMWPGEIPSHRSALVSRLLTAFGVSSADCRPFPPLPGLHYRPRVSDPGSPSARTHP